MNYWTLSNWSSYSSYWIDCVESMIHPRVENLRYYDDIGYYKCMKDEIPEMAVCVSKEFSDLSQALQSQHLILENMYEKMSVDLLFESREIQCDVKKKAFGVNRKKLEDQLLKNGSNKSDFTPQTFSSFSPQSKQRVSGFSSHLEKNKQKAERSELKKFMMKRRKSRIIEQIDSEIYGTSPSTQKYLFDDLENNEEYYPLVQEFFARNRKLLKLKQGGKIDENGNILEIDLLEYLEEFAMFSHEVYRYSEGGESLKEKTEGNPVQKEEKTDFSLNVKKTVEANNDIKSKLSDKERDKEEKSSLGHRRNVSVGDLVITVSPIPQRRNTKKTDNEC